MSLLHSNRGILHSHDRDPKHWDGRLSTTGKKFLYEAPLETWLTIGSVRVKSKAGKEDFCHSLNSWQSGVSWSFPRSYDTRDQGILDLTKYPFLCGPGRWWDQSSPHSLLLSSGSHHQEHSAELTPGNQPPELCHWNFLKATCECNYGFSRKDSSHTIQCS